MLELLRETRKNRYWVVACTVFRVYIYEKCCFFTNFHFFRKNSILISPKHFLTTLKFISSYLELVFNEKKAPLISLQITSFYHYTVCKNLVSGFQEFGSFLAKFVPTFVKKLFNSSANFLFQLFLDSVLQIYLLVLS